MANWTNILLIKERGLELVGRLNKANRKADFRRGKRLGPQDHIVRRFKPSSIRSLDWKTYRALPESVTVREVRIQVTQPEFRIKALVVVTTLLDPQQTTKDDRAALYRARWNNELDLRSIKITLQMDILRCKTPELVRKEIGAHVLAYNLIRTIMAQSAIQHEILPRSISFKGTLQTLAAFQPLIACQESCRQAHREELYQHLLHAIAQHRVADRPDRFEPRKSKRRPKNYDRLMKPRHEVKRETLRRVSDI